MTRLLVAVFVVTAALWAASCSSPIEEAIEAEFRQCVEAGGGSVGEDIEIGISNNWLVVVGGEVNAEQPVFDRCFEQARRLVP